ncbi:MAG: response regulator, partial [Roseburia sp.]|nr:response regulator [Roseburia sp.]
MGNENRLAGKAKILIVDDVETNRLVLEEIIKDMGCQPILAQSGEEALTMAKEQLPALVLSDISMPGMDGYELCRTLKKDKNTKNIPIIFISAFDDPMDIVEGFLLGGEDYITKPFIPEVVQARVGVHLSLHEAKSELMEMNRRLQISVSEQLKQMEL